MFATGVHRKISRNILGGKGGGVGKENEKEKILHHGSTIGKYVLVTNGKSLQAYEYWAIITCH